MIKDCLSPTGRPGPVSRRARLDDIVHLAAALLGTGVRTLEDTLYDRWTKGGRAGEEGVEGERTCIVG